MDGVEAVACDMNSDFQEAFEERCSHIRPVFDRFHPVKNFNDKVVSEVRKDEQRRLYESGEIEAVEALKKTRHILMSKRSTLRKKAPDDEYFFLKLFDASRTSYVRNPKSHTEIVIEPYFSGWQEPLIGHCAHPHPQEDFPFFLFFIILTIIAATTAIRTPQIMIVAIFPESQASIFFPPVPAIYFVTLTRLVSFVASR